MAVVGGPYRAEVRDVLKGDPIAEIGETGPAQEAAVVLDIVKESLLLFRRMR